jgi:hypothetical protein
VSPHRRGDDLEHLPARRGRKQKRPVWRAVPPKPVPTHTPPATVTTTTPASGQ